jgi:hypothetical protein
MLWKAATLAAVLLSIVVSLANPNVNWDSMKNQGERATVVNWDSVIRK